MRINHFGLVVKSLEKSQDFYCTQLGYTIKVPRIHVSNQQVDIIMLANTHGGPDLELITPNGDSSPSATALAKRLVLNHVCYETTDYELYLEKFKSKIVRPSMPAPVELFGGGRTFFAYLDSVLTEFLEIIN